MATIQARLNAEEKNLIINYAKVNNLSISDLIRDSVLEKIEDDIDLELYNKAMKSHLDNPQVISFEEMLEELNLD